MQKYDKIKTLKSQEFRRLTGVSKVVFQKMVAVVQVAEHKRMNQGGRPSHLCTEDKLLMTLEYFKESKVRWMSGIRGVMDSGYLGITHLQSTSTIPKKRSSKKLLTKEERQENRRISVERVLNENVIGKIKRYKILSDKYRNRRKRFGLRFNLIAAIYNLELEERQSKIPRKKEDGS